ncbi:MAG: hypothetical protein LC797_04280 [Chloroflexi bacterium]|nr:hypothetical protein [Chloroflexota bacterium]
MRTRTSYRSHAVSPGDIRDPRGFVFTHELPKNATGKILKRVLRDDEFVRPPSY